MKIISHTHVGVLGDARDGACTDEPMKQHAVVSAKQIVWEVRFIYEFYERTFLFASRVLLSNGFNTTCNRASQPYYSPNTHKNLVSNCTFYRKSIT